MERHHVWRNSELKWRAEHPGREQDEPEASFRRAADALAYIEAPVPRFNHSRNPADYTIIYQGNKRVVGHDSHGYAILDILDRSV